ncbi:MAG: PfkB family carbohydrate kinase, partial [Turicibacter sp.]
ILHFCSVSLIDAPIKLAHKKAIEFAVKHNGMISFDPNVRLPLWETPEACRQAILEFLPLAHIVKISDEELEFITGIADEEQALASLFVGTVQAVIYTKGTNGSDFITKTKKVSVNSFVVKAEDTTGAGDSFIGSFLYQVANEVNTLAELINLSDEVLASMLTFCSATAALTVSKKGAIGALPTMEDIQGMMNK